MTSFRDDGIMDVGAAELLRASPGFESGHNTALGILKNH